LKAVLLKAFGGSDQLYLGEIPRPEPSSQQVLIKVAAAALNRADILQRKGLYPPPQGASDILGMEVAGEVIEAGSDAQEKVGQQVMALLSGGGYAQYVAVHQNLTLPIPHNVSTQAAAGIMEAFITGWQALHWLLKIQPEQRILIHAGASGVGSASIQLSKLSELEIVTTASSSKVAFCQQLGADVCIDYRKEDFDQVIKRKYPEGVNAIMDFIGASYFQKNLNAMARDGRMVMLGLLGGSNLSGANLAPVLFKRLTIVGSTLRSRSLDYRMALIDDFNQHCHQHFTTGRLKPIIDRVFPWEQVAQAHDYLESNQNRGKVILKIA
jgi:putative PIG3 family NAD(P)H quinone oxidoreductase